MSTRSARIVAVSNTVIADNRLLTLVLIVVSFALLPYRGKSFLHSSKLLTTQEIERAARARWEHSLGTGAAKMEKIDEFFAARLRYRIRSCLVTVEFLKVRTASLGRDRGTRGRGKAWAGGTKISTWLSYSMCRRKSHVPLHSELFSEDSDWWDVSFCWNYISFCTK